MILLAPIAIVIWLLAARWRRTPLGLVVPVLAFAGLVAVNVLHWLLGRWTDGRVEIENLKLVMYPYTLLVPMGAAYIACLPRRRDVPVCASCGYDLTGLAGRAAGCPECGSLNPERLPIHYRPSGSPRADVREGDGPEIDRTPESASSGSPRVISGFTSDG